ncbi:MAG: nucleoside triphosphate pyrophosphohydrolase family protein [bacterium]
MNATEYQLRAHALAIYPEERAVEYVALGLASEAGEVAGKVKKQIRDGKNWTGEQRHEHLDKTIAELGDVMWYAAELATVLGIDLGNVMRLNLAKLESRRDRGVIAGDGDAR